MNIKKITSKLFEGKDLSFDETFILFNKIFKGNISEVELSAILIALKVKGEKPAEIAGAAQAMRENAIKLNLSEKIFDTCGTGGDNSTSFNISTAVALILSAYGIKIAKHGNRAISSKSGSADFLEALNIPINLTGKEAESYFKKHGFLFLFAPNYHPAMKYAMPVRKKLAVRTIFNYLGPLTNPLSPKKQMIGIFSPKFLETYAQTALYLNYEHLILYSAQNNMDEVSPTNKTLVYEIKNGKILKTWEINPSDFFDISEMKNLPKNKTAKENANIFIETLESPKITPLKKLLALNCSLALTIFKNTNLKENYNEMIDFLNSKKILEKINELRG